MRIETVVEIECICGKHSEIPLSKAHTLKSCDRCGRRIEIDMAAWNEPERQKPEPKSLKAAAA